MDLSQLKELQRKLKSLNRSRVEQDFKQVMLNNSENFTTYVADNWKQGKRPDGSIIGTYRSFAYEVEKRQRNPIANGNVDLIDTGSLKRGLIVNHLNGAFFNVFSTDKKAVDISDKYGVDVFGVPKDKKEQELEEVASEVMKLELAYLGL